MPIRFAEPGGAWVRQVRQCASKSVLQLLSDPEDPEKSVSTPLVRPAAIVTRAPAKERSWEPPSSRFVTSITDLGAIPVTCFRLLPAFLSDPSPLGYRYVSRPAASQPVHVSAPALS